MSASKTTSVTQKCKHCGGSLIFDPTKQTLVCNQCGNIVPVTGTPTTEKSFQALLINAPTWQKDAVVYQCDHCGAKSVVSKFDLVAKCDYCGAANMLKTSEMPGMRPDTIVPFRLSQADACSQVRNWLSKRWFVPHKFKHKLEIRQLSGVYYPAFTFDARVVARYTGVEVLTETVTNIVDGKEVSQEQTIRRRIGGVESHIFDDLLVLANEEMTTQMFSAIQPFDTNKGQVFQQSYLSGFTVSQASKEAIPCWEESRKSMDSVIRDKITTKYRNTIENLQVEMGITDVTYKYVLLPVYVGHTEYKGTKYQLFVNGQTGKVSGKTPKSWWKIVSLLAGMGLVAVGVGIMLAVFL